MVFTAPFPAVKMCCCEPTEPDCCVDHPTVKITISGISGTAACLDCDLFNVVIFLDCEDQICQSLGECGDIDELQPGSFFKSTWRGFTLLATRAQCLINIHLIDLISDGPISGGAKYGHIRHWLINLTTDWPGITSLPQDEHCSVFPRINSHPDCFGEGVGIFPCATVLPDLEACNSTVTFTLENEP